MPPRRRAAALLLALACAAAAGGAAQPAIALPDIACFDCRWLEDLPLDEWSAARNTTLQETLPWGQTVTFPPIDFRQLAEGLCECVLDSLEAPYGSHEPPGRYVRVNGTRLELEGETFRFAGFNAQQALAWAASGQPKLEADLASLFQHAQQLGLGVTRVWAGSAGHVVRPPFLYEYAELAPEAPEPAWAVVQPAPGEHNETALAALDRVVQLAEQHGIRLILNLADQTTRFGANPPGIEPYLKWLAGSLNLTGFTVHDFFTDERAKLIYKHFVCTLANRVNSLTGVKYKDSTAIMAWDLINEPRCPACPGSTPTEAVTAWAAEMSEFVRCIDSNHLVSIGTEGYFSENSTEFLPANPGPWSVCEGTGGTWDARNKSTCGWDCAMLWFRQWMGAHIAAAAAVGKPFVLEEFGVPWSTAQRDDMFRLVQEVFAAAWRNGSSPAAGSLFWGATAGEHVDWAGWQLRLDGGQTEPPPSDAAAALKAGMPAEQQQWLEAVDRMQLAFRRDEEAKACQEAAQRKLADVYESRESASALEIVRELAAEADSVTAAVPAAEAAAVLSC
ncbi:mannan endo-1,4-beta-mannosidase 9 [Micractinium conductrix]|uniref:mannan endo-1,4-beta-mannosidase n=1 Tax=Micractinium conductrix TaxID=554055 RepID=A0A2P6VS65_9CHLO|nr:mannan endo-1,4-beta-mannosidase 9 [Micractinium conductrix]|eukprot:PSC76925.1 mannan endo-1,4-beta-mannosidase 9 [Micractinium conductrix]